MKFQCKWAGGPDSLFSFRVMVAIDERILLLRYSGLLRNEGAPRVGFTRGRFVSHRHDRSGLQIKTMNNEIKSPTRKPDVWATQFISSLGARATRPDYIFRVGHIK